MALTIITQVLAVGCALLVNLIDYYWSDKRTRKFKQARLVLFCLSVGLLVASVGSSVWEETKKEREVEELRTQLEEITNELTGGEAYCYIDFSYQVGTEEWIGMWLQNHGDYPLYDTQIRFVDLNKFQDLEFTVPMSRDEVAKAETVKTIGTLGPRCIVILPDISTSPDLDGYAFNVWIHTRHRRFYEEARIRRVETKWRVAQRVFEQTETGRHLLFERVPADYPGAGSPDEIWSTWPPD